MTEKWTAGDAVLVVKQGVTIEGFINTVDKKNGMLHVRTSFGPITLLAGSDALTRGTHKETPSYDKAQNL
jgi:hypothetical protein